METPMSNPIRICPTIHCLQTANASHPQQLMLCWINIWTYEDIRCPITRVGVQCVGYSFFGYLGVKINYKVSQNGKCHPPRVASSIYTFITKLSGVEVPIEVLNSVKENIIEFYLHCGTSTESSQVSMGIVDFLMKFPHLPMPTYIFY